MLYLYRIAILLIWELMLRCESCERNCAILQEMAIFGHFRPFCSLVRRLMCSPMVISFHMGDGWYQDISLIQLQTFKKIFTKLCLS